MNRLALPLLFLPALAQASFLGDLAANPNVVSSSPYATGGDVILQLGADEYVHVFTNTAAAAAFTPAAAVTARILMVGGGGSGGSRRGGGGGAGGFLELASVYLSAGAYTVTVGAGGAAVTEEKTQGNNGGDTSLALGETTLYTAPGGGGGGAADISGRYLIAGKDGASGGGGGPSCSGGAATAVSPILGNAGGTGNNSNNAASGGGGAGGAGAGGYGSNTSTGANRRQGGAGGAGVASDITGDSFYYAAGGGGSCWFDTNGGYKGIGGSGVGGDGAGWTNEKNADYTDATSGEDGTGSGGGGAAANKDTSGNPTITATSGAGGSGIVIVRYTAGASAGDDPIIQVFDVADIGTTSATLALYVPYAGSADDTVTLSFTLSFDEDGENVVSSWTDSDYIGASSPALSSLLPGQTYHLSATATSSTGTASASTSFTTAPMFSETLAYTATGNLAYTIDGTATADSQRLELWIGPDAASLTNQATYADASLLAAGAHAIQPFTTEQFGESVAILLRHIAIVGARAFTNDTDVLSTTLSDGTTYTWNGAVAEGDWCVAANWTASAAGGRGWPTAGSIAKFPATTTTARIDRAVTIYQTQFTGNAASDITLRGTAPGATLTTGFSGDNAFPQGAYTLDALAVVRMPAANVKMNAATSLEIVNGASFTSAGSDCALNNSAASLTVGAGSTFSAKVVGGLGTAGQTMPRMVVAGTVDATGDFRFTYAGAANKPALNLVLDGPSARVKTGNGCFYAANSNATVTVNLTPGAYSATEALIRQTGGSTKMANSGRTIVFSAPASEGSKALGKCEIFVADWTRSSINTSLVEFGEVDRDGSYFYFTEAADSTGTRYKSAAEVTAASATVKCIWYHHAPPSGTVLIVK